MAKCECGNNLKEMFSVQREYASDTLGSRFAKGHYDKQDHFDPDIKADLSDASFDTFDGADTCTACGEVVG